MIKCPSIHKSCEQRGEVRDCPYQTYSAWSHNLLIVPTPTTERICTFLVQLFEPLFPLEGPKPFFRPICFFVAKRLCLNKILWFNRYWAPESNLKTQSQGRTAEILYKNNFKSNSFSVIIIREFNTRKCLEHASHHHQPATYMLED